MKYCLIGCGRIAVNHLKAAINNGLDIEGLCDIESSHIDILLSKLGINDNRFNRFENYKEMIQTVHPDFVAIATESGKHANIALYCIRHGVSVIIEKPMAMSIDDAKQMIEESYRNHVKICVSHQNRFNKATVATKKAIMDGRFGKISNASICVRWNRNPDYYNQAKWRGTWADDGGCLMNQCIHGVDLLLYLIGQPVAKVYGQTRQQFHHYLEAEDLGTALITFADGTLATIEGTVNVFPKNLEETLHIFGEKGTVKIGGTSTNNIDVWQFSDSKDYDSESANLIEQTSNVYGNGHTALYKNMMDAITTDTDPLISGTEGIKALEVILAIYKSQLTGEVINLPLEHFSTMDMKGYFNK